MRWRIETPSDDRLIGLRWRRAGALRDVWAGVGRVMWHGWWECYELERSPAMQGREAHWWYWAAVLAACMAVLWLVWHYPS